MERAIHTPFVPQGVPHVSKPFDLTAPKAVRPPCPADRSVLALLKPAALRRPIPLGPKPKLPLGEPAGFSCGESLLGKANCAGTNFQIRLKHTMSLPFNSIRRSGRRDAQSNSHRNSKFLTARAEPTLRILRILYVLADESPAIRKNII